MTTLRERIADMNRYDDWRRAERLAELATEEEDARKLASEINLLLGRVTNRIPDDPADRQCWTALVELLRDAATTANQIVSGARVKSDDVRMGD